MIDLNQVFKSVLEADRAAVVICDLDHRIIYMNPAAIGRYVKWGGEALLGKSLLDCHNEKSREMIHKVVGWFQASKESEIPALVSPREAPAGYRTVTLLNADGTIAGWGANDYNLSDYNPASPGQTQFGRLYFNNDGSDTQLFHIFIPIAVKYNWGNIAYDKKLAVPAKLDKNYTQTVWAVITVNGTH